MPFDMGERLLKTKILFFSLALLVCITISCDKKVPTPSEAISQTNDATIEMVSPKPQEGSISQKPPNPTVEYLSIYEAKELVEPITEIEMVLVEGGTMEIQGKEVSLDSFYMNRYVLNENIYTEAHNWAYDRGYLGDGSKRWNLVGGGAENTLIRWSEAIAVCNHLSTMEGLIPVYYSENGTEPILSEDGTIETRSGPTGSSISFHSLYINWGANGYRLPTEAEWEYAARGGNKTKGYMYSGSDTLKEVISYYNDNLFYSSQDMQYVPGQKKPNELGIYDMTSVAPEWCLGPWREYGEMEPAHNPGRISVYDYASPFYLLRKGGGYPSISEDPNSYKPESREQASYSDEDRFLFRASLRLVRNAE
jgi:hypothetical protein